MKLEAKSRLTAGKNEARDMEHLFEVLAGDMKGVQAALSQMNTCVYDEEGHGFCHTMLKKVYDLAAEIESHKQRMIRIAQTSVEDAPAHRSET
jgi:hypothetical protein